MQPFDATPSLLFGPGPSAEILSNFANELACFDMSAACRQGNGVRDLLALGDILSRGEWRSANACGSSLGVLASAAFGVDGVEEEVLNLFGFPLDAVDLFELLLQLSVFILEHTVEILLSSNAVFEFLLCGLELLLEELDIFVGVITLGLNLFDCTFQQNVRILLSLELLKPSLGSSVGCIELFAECSIVSFEGDEPCVLRADDLGLGLYSTGKHKLVLLQALEPGVSSLKLLAMHLSLLCASDEVRCNVDTWR